VAVTLQEGIQFDLIAKALSEFTGVGRRFEVRGVANKVTVVDDYAHHPTEIRATLAAAKQRYPDCNIWAVWQPHTYSRVKALLSDFSTCFKDANQVIMLDIYRSRETNTLGLTAESILKQIKHPQVRHVGELAAAADYLLDHCQPNDVILTLNAGDARIIGDWILEGLRERAAQAIANEEEYVMGDDEKQQDEKQTDEEKMFKLDATASQVRRLVDRLKKAKQEGDDESSEAKKKDE
jgi:UDP-N-acetylmuramate--alanine ligase